VPRQVVLQLNKEINKPTLAQGKQNLSIDCPKGKLEFKFFSSLVEEYADFLSFTIFSTVFKLLILLHCPSFLLTSEF